MRPRFRNARHHKLQIFFARFSTHTDLNERRPMRRALAQCPSVDAENPEETSMQDRESHGKPIEELVSGLQTHLERGLTPKEAGERLTKFGANELTERQRPGFLALLWDQFNNYLVTVVSG
jgi:magnesium-transporting ATPase (P-type)